MRDCPTYQSHSHSTKVLRLTGATYDEFPLQISFATRPNALSVGWKWSQNTCLSGSLHRLDGAFVMMSAGRPHWTAALYSPDPQQAVTPAVNPGARQHRQRMSNFFPTISKESDFSSLRLIFGPNQHHAVLRKNGSLPLGS